MKKLPEIYKEVVNVNNNRNTFYSKNSDIVTKKEIKTDNKSISDKLNTIFSLGSNSYTKKVKIEAHGEVYETRFVRRNRNKILTIDNSIIKEEDITNLEIL